MTINNKYRGRGYAELEELEIEYVMLYKDAYNRRDFSKANEYEYEVRLIRDAIYDYERGEAD